MPHLRILALIVLLACTALFAQSVPPAQPTALPDSTSLVPISTPQPSYPAAAAQKGLQGQVWLKFSVTENGDVDAVEVISGDPLLAEAATDALKKWKFQPFIKSGKPARVASKKSFDFASPQTSAAAPAPTTAPLEIPQNVTASWLVQKVAPTYPPSARSQGVTGSVKLRAVIGRDGRVLKLDPVSGHPDLTAAAVAAVKQWRYKPYLVNGEPVEVQTFVTVNFTLGW